ncbi:tetratricopeptide repeat protein [Anoxybacterium hadale]|uniref:Tetratricopeptide repeat protein n=1 Tax=Anoxybacterium hadale TaxID=3408580 RepID=A0ACD1AAF7_9FIRM|nr:tetratricopeptide repeat protein [Clostridiales bacterium]
MSEPQAEERGTRMIILDGEGDRPSRSRMEDMLERRLERLLMEPDQPKRYNDVGVPLLELEEIELAEMYFQKGYQMMKARQELKLESEELKLLENYGLVLYRLGRYDEALTIYQEALQFDIENEKILEPLGELSYLLGGQK